MDGQGLQTLKPSPSVIHCHPAIISESLIHFASVQDLAKSITVAPICVCSGGGAGAGGGEGREERERERERKKGMQRRQVNSSLCCFKALSVL